MRNKVRGSLWTILVAMCCLVTTACSEINKDDDASALLKTVPSDAVIVGIIDVSDVAAKLGKAESDGKITFDKGTALGFIDADSGVKQSVVVAYSTGNSEVVTGFIEDEDTFKSIIEDNEGKIWENENNYNKCGNTIVRDNQFWYIRQASAEEENELVNVKPRNSLFENSHIEKALPVDKDVKFYVDYSRFMSHVMSAADYRTIMSVKNLTSMASFDVSYLVGSVDFEQDRVALFAETLDAAGNPAEAPFELSHLSKDMLQFVPKDAELVVGIGTTSQMWKSLLTNLQSMLPMMLNNAQNSEGFYLTISAILSNLDGNIVFAGEMADATMSGGVLLLESGNEVGANKLMNAIGAIPGINSLKELSMTTTGKLVNLKLGNVSSEMGRPDLAHLFDGPYMAMYVSGEMVKKLSEKDILSQIELTAATENSMQALIYVDKGEYQNSLEACVEEIVSK